MTRLLHSLNVLFRLICTVDNVQSDLTIVLYYHIMDHVYHADFGAIANVIMTCII